MDSYWSTSQQVQHLLATFVVFSTQLVEGWCGNGFFQGFLLVNWSMGTNRSNTPRANPTHSYTLLHKLPTVPSPSRWIVS